MPEAISHEHTPRDVKEEFYQQLQQLGAASEKRVEAMQDAYAILQLLHDKGILELVKDALGSGEKLMEVVAGVMQGDQVIRAVRNLKTLAKLIGTVEPETLKKIITQFSPPQS